MKKKWEDVLFLGSLLVIVFFGVVTITKTGTLVSGSENRSLAQFEPLTLEGFLNGSFQDNFEAALSDQFVLSEEIRFWHNRMIAEMTLDELEQLVCLNNYVELGNSVDRRRATFNCEDYMVYFPEELSDEQIEIIKENVSKYSHVNSVTDAYYYFVNDSSVYNFKEAKKVIDYATLLKTNMTGKYYFGELDFKDYEGHKKYFYKTDHHLNYRGAQKIYEDVVSLLGKDGALKPTGFGTNHEYFFGSFAQNTKNYDVKEEFNYYEYEIPRHKTMIDRIEKNYGNRDNYKSHNYEYDKKVNYYAYYYGSDEGEIIFDYDQPNEENLLIISNSYSNAVNELIATHFNKTYVVDLRYYEREIGEGFQLSEYIKKNKIDKTLLLMSPGFVYSKELNVGLEL